MIQAFGLTSDSRKDLSPAVDDVSFEAHAGRVTVLLGTPGAGKTTTLRLMLELQKGRGIAYFRGRPLHRIPHPSREVGVLLGDVPGHPSRTVRGHLRMLCAAAGLPVRRADEVLEVVGLVSFREERLGTLSRGMDRHLGLACALLPDPHTLVLDNPADGLSAQESRWLHGMLRAHASQGGTVLFTTADPKEAARTADRVVTLERGRLVADQEAGDFARNRLRPRVAVRSPHAARLAAILAKEARTAHRSVEVVRERGNRLFVYGSTCADVGEIAFRHGILVHQLADEVGDMGAGAGAEPRAGTAEGAEAGRNAGADTVTGAAQPVAARAAEDARTGDPAPGAASAAPPAEVVISAPAEPVHAESVHAECVHAERVHAGAGFDEASGSLAGDGASAGTRLAGASVTVLPERGTVPARGEAASATRVSGTAPAAARRDGAAVAARTGHAPPAARDEAASGQIHPDARARAVGSEVADAALGTHPGAVSATTGSDGSSATTDPGPSSAVRHPDTAVPTTGPENTPSATSPPSATDPDGTGAPTRPDDGSTPASGPTPLPLPHPPQEPTRAAAADALPTTGPRSSVPQHAPPARSATHSGTSPTSPAGSEPTTPRPSTGTPRSAGARTATTRPAAVQRSIPTPRPAEAVTLDASSLPPPPIRVRVGPSPLRPLRYELRRASGIGTGFVTAAAVLVVSVLTALAMGRIGHTSQPRLLAAWPRQLPLPPAALGAGLLGALASGDEFRHPALAADRGTVPRRLGLLTAKLLVATAAALLLAFLTIGCDAEVLYLLYGRELTQVPGDWLSMGASWIGLVVGCAWAGVLAAGLFRSTSAGLAAVVAVPVVVVPVVQGFLGGTAGDTAGLPGRLRRAFLLQWPFGGDRYLAAAARVIAQPVGGALTLSLTALLGGYLWATLRSRVR